MAFWDAEKEKLGDFGVAMRKPTARVPMRAPVRGTVRGGGVMQGKPATPDASGEIDPKAVAAAVPADVKVAMKAFIPPSLAPKTTALLTATKQLVQQSKAKTAEVKKTTSSLKGFFGFGAAPVPVISKVAITAKAVAETKLMVAKLTQAKADLAMHKSDLLKTSAVIKGEKAKLAQSIAKKMSHKANIEEKMAKIPKTITKTV